MAVVVTASVADLARGLRNRCETIAGLKCYDIMHPTPAAPAVCVNGPVRWTYDETMDGVWRPVFELWIYVNPANLPDAQRAAVRLRRLERPAEHPRCRLR